MLVSPVAPSSQLPVGLRHPAVALVEMRELGTLRYLFWKVY